MELGSLSPSLTCGSPSPSPSPSEVSDECSSGSLAPSKKVEQVSTACQTAFLFPALTSSTSDKLPYIDLSKWRREEICCGVVFRGPCGEVLVDPKLLNPLCTCSCSSKATAVHLVKWCVTESIYMWGTTKTECTGLPFNMFIHAWLS